MLEQDFLPYQLSEHRKGEFKNSVNGPTISIFFRFLTALVILFQLLTTIIVSANPLGAYDVVLVRQFNFSKSLENPCDVAEQRRPNPAAITPERRQEDRQALYRALNANTLLIKDAASAILRKKDELHGCPTGNLYPVATIPKAGDLFNCEPRDALCKIYASLVNHTAYVFFISELLQHYSGDACNSGSLLESARALGRELKSLVCYLQWYIRTLQSDSEVDETYFSVYKSQILNHPLAINEPNCSRRTVLICQTIKSTVTLLTETSSYLQNNAPSEDEYPS